LGLLSFVAIFVGGLIAGASASAWGYVAGFLLIVGFDKMFSVYIRSARQAIVPAKDYGKTTGVIILLNNLTQPLAGLIVGFVSGNAQIGLVVLLISLSMGLLGATITAVAQLGRFSKRFCRSLSR